MGNELDYRLNQVAGECNALRAQIERINDAKLMLIREKSELINSFEFRQYELQVKQLQDELDRKNSLYNSMSNERG
ncbi:MAG: hypothetical protein LBI14_03415 [Treponema sp.]|jgi:hypothetical protein|nr:hypothetical protein [Treponema sp.]